MMVPPKKDNHLPVSMFYKNGAYYFVETIGEKRKWHRLGTDLEQSLAAYGRRHAFSLQLMSDVFNRYRTQVMPKKAESTRKKENQYLDRLDKVFGAMPPRQVQKIYIYQYLDRRPPVTGNREITTLSDVFRKAILWGVLDDNPCAGIEKNKETPRDRYVSDAEFWTVWRLAPPIIQIAMELDLMLGLRPGDLLSLNRKNLTEKGILIQTSKTRKALLFEWNDEVVEIIERAKRLRSVGSFYLLPNQKGQRYTVDGFRQLWRRVMLKFERAGGERFQFRDLRAKSGSDHHSGDHLGHRNKHVLERVYKRKPTAVKPLKIGLSLDK